MNETSDVMRYKVTFCSGPPGFADFVTLQFATLEEARKCRREHFERSDPFFRWSKIDDLVTGKQLME